MEIKRLVRSIIKITVTVILIMLLFEKVTIEDLKKTAGIIKKEDLCVSIFISLISVVVNAVKWKVLLPDMPVWRLIKTCFKAQFYSMVLPGQLFGEASKVLDLKGSNETQGKVISSVIVDKITALIGTMAVGIFGVVFTSIQVPDSLRVFFAAMLCILMAFMLISRLQCVHTLVVCSSYCLWKSSDDKKKKLGGRLYQLYDIFKSYAGSGIILFLSVFLGAANQLLAVFQVWMIAGRMGLAVNYVEYCWIMPAVSVILLLPVSFGGIGVREISLSGFLALFDAASEEAIVISAVLLLSQFAAAVIGVMLIIYDNINHFRQKN